MKPNRPDTEPVSDQDYEHEASPLGIWITVALIIASILGAMYGFSQYTSVLP